jgi:hypothetical protein
MHLSAHRLRATRTATLEELADIVDSERTPTSG